jgi:hypothetical protein
VPRTLFPVVVVVAGCGAVGRVAVATVLRGDRCPHGAADRAAEDSLVAPAEFAADDRADGGAQTRANCGACMIVVRSYRQRHQGEQEGNQSYAKHGGYSFVVAVWYEFRAFRLNER